jgi:hypothetical protein
MAKKRQIALLGHPIVNEEGVAGEAITPGALVKGVGTILNHATAAGNALPAFALERDEFGDDIDTAYAVGDTVKVGVFHSGQRVNAFIESGQNITAGALMESAGDGSLKVFGSGVVVGVSRTTTGAVTARTRIELEIK